MGRRVGPFLLATFETDREKFDLVIKP